MKVAIGVSLVSIALGIGAGIAIERARSARETSLHIAGIPAAPGTTAADEDPSSESDPAALSAEEIQALRDSNRELRAQVALLETNRPAIDQTTAQARVADLRARIPELLEKKDGAGLISLMKELAALGPDGYGGALEIAQAFQKEFGSGEEAFGIGKVQFNKSFSGPMIPVMQWALDNPANASPWFRAKSVHMMYWVSDVDAGPIFIAALAKEKDAAVAAAMAGYLANLARPEMAVDLENAAKMHAGKPQTLASILSALVSIRNSTSEAALRDLTGSSDPKLRDAASLALIEHSPPAAGIMVTSAAPKTQAERAGIVKGDVIVSYDGKTVTSMDQLKKLVSSKPASEVVTVMVNRGGTLIPMQVGGGKIGVDGKFVRP